MTRAVLIGLAAFLGLVQPSVFAREPAVAADHSDAAPGGSIGEGLDRFLVRASVAADAASIVAGANDLRRRAHDALAEGRRDEARDLLRQAGASIASAAPEGDDRADDPLLAAYLAELTDEITRLQPRRERVDDLGIGAFADGPLPPMAGSTRGRLARLRPMMSRVFGEKGLPEWLLAVGLVESGYSTAARSPKGALGIWQFMPATARRFGLVVGADVDERTHPERSTRAAAAYLRSLYELFGDWRLAIAAYNAGEARVARAMRQTNARDFETLAARGALPRETIEYVPRVLAAAKALSLGVEDGARDVRRQRR